LSSGDTLAIFRGIDGEVPGTGNIATTVFRNGHCLRAFDSAELQSTVFEASLPRNYSGNGITIYIHWVSATATNNNVVWTGAFERVNDGSLDIDGDSFASAKTVTSAAAATSGVVITASISFSNSEIDGLTVGDIFRLKVSRDGADASDNMAGDAQLLAVEVIET
jgi:hypothetical protein